MVNQKIVQIFGEIADMLEITGENPFRIRAYRRAVEALGRMGDLEQIHKDNDSALEAIPGIGKELHLKIIEIIETGRCEMHEQLAQKLPSGILDLLRVRGLGPKKVKLFYDQLGIHRLEQLRSAAESGALATLPGMGEKSQAVILDALNQLSFSKERIPYAEALKRAEKAMEYLHSFPALEQLQYAGSLRRKQATVGDIDLLATSTDVPGLMDYFVKMPGVQRVLGQGETKSSITLEGNVQIDLRVVDPESFGAALFYFTGPKHFNIHVRTMALKRGLKINEYGLFDGDEKRAGRTEEEMFAGLDLPYLTPEQRESFQ